MFSQTMLTPNLICRVEMRAGEGRQPDELYASLLDLLTTVEARRHEATTRRVVALMAERGYGDSYDAWNE